MGQCSMGTTVTNCSHCTCNHKTKESDVETHLNKKSKEEPLFPKSMTKKLGLTIVKGKCMSKNTILNYKDKIFSEDLNYSKSLQFRKKTTKRKLKGISDDNFVIIHDQVNFFERENLVRHFKNGFKKKGVLEFIKGLKKISKSAADLEKEKSEVNKEIFDDNCNYSPYCNNIQKSSLSISGRTVNNKLKEEKKNNSFFTLNHKSGHHLGMSMLVEGMKNLIKRQRIFSYSVIVERPNMNGRQQTKRNKSKKYELLMSVLEKENLIESEMSEETVKKIANLAKVLKIKEKYTLYNTKKNPQENIMYIVYKGKLELNLDGEFYALNQKQFIKTSDILSYTKERSTIKIPDKVRVSLLRFPMDEYNNMYKQYKETLKKEKLNFISQINFFTNGFSKKDLPSLAEAGKKCYFKERKLILKEDEITEFFYCIMKGKVLCLKENKIIKELQEKQMFGEIFLFQDDPSIYSYVIEPNSELFILEHNKISQIYKENTLEQFLHTIYMNSIKSSDILTRFFKTDTLNSLYNHFYLKKYEDSIIVSLNEKLSHSKLFILLGGQIFKLKNNSDSNAFENSKIENCMNKEVGVKGQFFGETLLSEIPSKNNNYSIYTDECIVFEIDLKVVLKATVNNKDESSLFHKISLMKNFHLFQGISIMNLINLADNMKFKTFHQGETICKGEALYTKFFILVKGEVKLYINNSSFDTVKVNQGFGKFGQSEEIKEREMKKVKKMCYISSSNITNVFYIEKDNYNEIVDRTILQSYCKLLSEKDKSVTLEQLIYIKELGEGSYGKVFLVHDTKKLFALKSAEIKIMVQNKSAANNYLSEKRIMYSLEHPFVVRIINTFKSNENIFFLTEYVNGITLKDYINQKYASLDKSMEKVKELKKNVTETTQKFNSKTSENNISNNTMTIIKPQLPLFRNNNEISFIAAILFSALTYFQSKRIIHRDLKPDNIMIDKFGYLKVIDFGLAKILEKDYTYSLAGTLHYISPEVIYGKPYSYCADIWSTGVLLYEIFYGKVPFGADCSDVREVYHEICHKKLPIPSDVGCNNFNTLVKDLLSRNKNNRLNALKKWKNYELLKHIDYKKLLGREIPSFFSFEFNANEEQKLIKNSETKFLHFISKNNNSSKRDYQSNVDDFLSEF